MIPGTKGKILKKKKEVVEFGADNIDNTAPVKKILDDLQHKNDQAFTYYCQTIRPRPARKEDKNFHFTLTGHPIYAYPDDWEGDLNSGYFESFSYKSLMPNMITQLKNCGKIDPVSESIKLKMNWHYECQTLRNIAVSKSLVDKYESLNDEVVYCPKHLVDMAAYLDSDPDPYFDDSYNWYYAGHGNMQLICVNWVDYLLHSEFNTLYLTQFKKNEFYLETEHCATFDCEGNNILETICSSDNIVALRTKHKVYILKVSFCDDKIEFQKIKATESEEPFTSISFDSHHKNILYITTIKNKLTIVNLDRLKGRTVHLKEKVNSFCNNWNSVISSDRVTYTHVSRDSISIYDKRTNHANCMWNSFRDVTDHLACNTITAAQQYKDSFSLYYATNHHFYLLDLRNEKRYKPKPVLRWTHGMQCPPIYSSFCDFEFNKELICLCSQWCEDMCLVPSYNRNLTRDIELPGTTMPYRPPSILSTLNEAKQKLLCHELYKPINDRLVASITGNIVMENGENYVILMQNSLGDISCHVLYPGHMESFIEDNSIEHLKNWSEELQPEKKPFEVSTVKDISAIWKALKRVPDNYVFCDSEIKKESSESVKNEVLDIFEKDDLDVGLLDVWEKDTNEISVADKSSLAINLHYSGDESVDASV
ncbi:hypothetical protein O0L34_g15632 [Tuta absoluta]|nr:hypothetical protein O0L34_g15632 [Tuta absoluta]